MVIRTIICTVAAYLLGCFNGALIYSNLVRHEDIRRFGSGNAGSTNVLRVYGLLPALCVFAFDALKGSAVVLICRQVCAGSDISLIAATLAVVIGHDFPVFTHYKGGKGIATTFGAALILVPKIALAALAAAVAILLITGLMALGTLTAVFCAAIAVLVIPGCPFAAKVCVPVLFVLTAWQHRGNIGRLLKGQENRIEFGKKER